MKARSMRGKRELPDGISEFLDFEDYCYYVNYHLSVGKKRQAEKNFAEAIEDYGYAQSLVDINNASEHWSSEQKARMLYQWAIAQEKIAECSASSDNKAKQHYELLLDRLKSDVAKPYPLANLQSQEKNLVESLLKCYQKIAKAHISLGTIAWNVAHDAKTAISHIEQLRGILPAVRNISQKLNIKFDDQYKDEGKEMRSSTEALLSAIEAAKKNSYQEQPSSKRKAETDALETSRVATAPAPTSPQPMDSSPRPPSVASPYQEQYLQKTSKPLPLQSPSEKGHPPHPKQVAIKSSARHMPEAPVLFAAISSEKFPLKKRYFCEEFKQEANSKKARGTSTNEHSPAAASSAPRR